MFKMKVIGFVVSVVLYCAVVMLLIWTVSLSVVLLINLFWQLWGCMQLESLAIRLCVGRTEFMFLICSVSLCKSCPPDSFPPTMPELELAVVRSDAQGQEAVWIYLQLLFNFQPPSEKSWCSFLKVRSLIMMTQRLPCVCISRFWIVLLWSDEVVLSDLVFLFACFLCPWVSEQ